MILADYTFYVEEFQGTEIPSELFRKYITRADYILKRMTQNRVVESYYETQYNLAACAIAEYAYNNPKSVSATSESLGDYSIQYGAMSNKVDFETTQLAIDYLGNTGLLHSGVITC